MSKKRCVQLAGVVFGVIALLAISYCYFRELMAVKVDLALACSENACHEEVFLLHGEVTSISELLVREKMEYMAEQYSDVKTICISSKGGVTSAAMSIADTIYDLGLNTCLASRYKLSGDSNLAVKGLCQSSCTWMILAGKDRVLYDDKVELGFHAARDIFGSRADDELQMLMQKVESYVSRRPDSSVEVEKLSRLSWWAFQQGAKRDTTNCTAHELQSKYPYFTVVRSSGTPPASSCGLKAPEDVQEILE